MISCRGFTAESVSCMKKVEDKGEEDHRIMRCRGLINPDLRTCRMPVPVKWLSFAFAAPDAVEP